MIVISDVFFPQISNGVDSFPKKFHFHLQKVQNVLYLKKCIFNILFYPLDRKLSIFYSRACEFLVYTGARRRLYMAK